MSIHQIGCKFDRRRKFKETSHVEKLRCFRPRRSKKNYKANVNHPFNLVSQSSELLREITANSLPAPITKPCALNAHKDTATD